mgnify:CR=1 FL=1
MPRCMIFLSKTCLLAVQGPNATKISSITHEYGYTQPEVLHFPERRVCSALKMY